jgi:hypothetical protein
MALRSPQLDVHARISHLYLRASSLLPQMLHRRSHIAQCLGEIESIHEMRSLLHTRGTFATIQILHAAHQMRSIVNEEAHVSPWRCWTLSIGLTSNTTTNSPSNHDTACDFKSALTPHHSCSTIIARFFAARSFVIHTGDGVHGLIFSSGGTVINSRLIGSCAPDSSAIANWSEYGRASCVGVVWASTTVNSPVDEEVRHATPMSPVPIDRTRMEQHTESPTADT